MIVALEKRGLIKRSSPRRSVQVFLPFPAKTRIVP
jgi:hypothetical protein